MSVTSVKCIANDSGRRHVVEPILLNLPVASDYEVIEIKGRGHPDTLSDALAEKLSSAYSLYCLNQYGAVLHHNFDKVGLLGGKSFVSFGRGHMLSPIRVLLNGRASVSFGGDQIDVYGLLEPVCRSFLADIFANLDTAKDITIQNNLSAGSSPGHVETGNQRVANRAHWFSPRSLQDLRERSSLNSNDTSVGVGFAPFTPLEAFVVSTERKLTDPHRLERLPWQGTDIKIMAVRVGRSVILTMCVPQIAGHVPDAESYRRNLSEVHAEVLAEAQNVLPDCRVALSVNTKDNFDIPELYLTAIGSSIESGDEGLVGRGNRSNGIISMVRPYSMEGAAGKNPVYHVGKLYNVAAQAIAAELVRRFGGRHEVWMVSQEGRALHDPWQIVVRTDSSIVAGELTPVVSEILDRLPEFTTSLIDGRIRVY
jgi:S-adenosylmethionine synthetase